MISREFMTEHDYKMAQGYKTMIDPRTVSPMQIPNEREILEEREKREGVSEHCKKILIEISEATNTPIHLKLDAIKLLLEHF